MKNVELVNIRQLPWVNRGDVYTITDLLTGLEYNIVGEHNNQRHADYVCATREDTEIKRITAGGSFENNWEARPVILTIGDRHFAASTHSAVHPPDMRWRNPQDIGHSGHFCLWVLEGTTSGSESYRRSMIEAVHRAYKMAHEIQIPTPAPSPPTTNNSALEGVAPWAADGWLWAIEALGMDGTRPRDNITRQEVMTLLHRMHNLPRQEQSDMHEDALSRALEMSMSEDPAADATEADTVEDMLSQLCNVQRTFMLLYNRILDSGGINPGSGARRLASIFRNR